MSLKFCGKCPTWKFIYVKYCGSVSYSNCRCQTAKTKENVKKKRGENGMWKEGQKRVRTRRGCPPPAQSGSPTRGSTTQHPPWKYPGAGGRGVRQDKKKQEIYTRKSSASPRATAGTLSVDFMMQISDCEPTQQF